jgi:hypothetical protein
MQRHRLFAAGATVALLLGGATPALAAKPSHANGPKAGHVKGPKADKPAHPAHPAKPAKPTPKPKKSKAGVSGGGVTSAGAEFSVQGRADGKPKGHFNYTSATLTVRCKGVTYSAPGTITSTTCVEKVGEARTPISVTATFVDSSAGDTADITFTRPDGTVVEDGADGAETLQSGNIRVRS